MRGLFGSCFVLALGLVAATGRAEELPRWRPVAQPGPAAASSPPAGVSLQTPVPLSGSPEAGVVRPASFNPVTPDALRFTARAKPTEQAPMPMPVGPVPVGTPSKAPETAPAPAPAGPDSVHIWGGPPVSNWVGDGFPGQDGGVVSVLPGGDSCGEGACCPGGPCCCPGGCRSGGVLGFLRGLCGGGAPACCECPDGACPTGWARNGCCGCPADKVWLRAEYLLWWVKNGNAPVLVAATPFGSSFGGADTVALAGPNLDYNLFSGARFTAGVGIPGACNTGVEATWFFLGERSTNFVAGTANNAVITRPVIDAVTGASVGQLVSDARTVGGAVSVSSTSRLWGVEGNLRQRLWCGCNGYLDLLGGFRYLELREALQVNENLTVLATSADATQPRLGAPPGTAILVTDSFSTRNHFYGGQLGLDGEYRRNRWFVGGTVKVGLGVMHERVSINGLTSFPLIPGSTPLFNLPGGLLAQPTNIGSRSSDQFAVVPEVGVRVGYQVTDHVRVFVGYNFLYASNVVRPGDQIDPVVNLRQLPTVFGAPAQPVAGPQRPLPLFRHTDFWAQGVNFGLEIKY
jgi:hypothetical protein